MKLRLLPVVVSVVVSSVVLFGGWFAYSSLAMENPLSDIINQASGVEQSKIDLTADRVHIELKLQPNADLREIIHKISTEGASIIGKRELKVEVTGESTPALEDWWSKALFDVAQAMETKHYSDIPVSLNNRASELSGLKVETEMDNKYVYIRLTEGDKSKFVMLPRVPAQIGVWPNE